MMTTLTELVRKAVRPYHTWITIALVLAVFLYATYYYFNSRSKITLEHYEDIANANRRSKEAIIYFFHVDWCPHCKKALPAWQQFKTASNGKEVNGYILTCMDVDCTEENANTTSMINKFAIDSYPTVKLVRDNQTIDFDSKITASTLGSFITTMLND
jgi:thioredoxin-like negative regulator of GroEL